MQPVWNGVDGNRYIAEANVDASVRRSQVNHRPLVGVAHAEQPAAHRPTLWHFGGERLLERVLEAHPWRRGSRAEFTQLDSRRSHCEAAAVRTTRRNRQRAP